MTRVITEALIKCCLSVRVSLLMILMLIEINGSYCLASTGFFGQRYQGWLWFEEEEQRQQAGEQESEHQYITPEIAKAEIEKLAKDLEELKFVMLARPTKENVKAYRDKENEMWSKAFKLEEEWRMSNFLYPAANDLIDQPINVHGVKMKRKVEAEANAKIIREFSAKFNLVLFFKGDCPYCHEFAPVLKHFGEQYGFNIEAVSMDGGKLELFKSVKVPELVIKLGIEAAPTVVAISRDSKIAFELIRGYASISELEEYSLLAVKHLKQERKW